MILDNYIEQWKPIKGYEGMYEISTYGRVRSLNYNHTKRPKLLSLGLSADKRYYGVCLCKHGKVKRFRVNRLVAETFIPNPCNYPTNRSILPQTNERVADCDSQLVVQRSGQARFDT